MLSTKREQYGGGGKREKIRRQRAGRHATNLTLQAPGATGAVGTPPSHHHYRLQPAGTTGSGGLFVNLQHGTGLTVASVTPSNSAVAIGASRRPMAT